MSQYAWHFIRDDWRSGEGDLGPWRDGAIERHSGELIPCKSGLHSSPTPWDALQYAPGPLLSLVEIPDDCIPHGDPVDKHVSQWRRRIKTIDISKELRLFACDVAEEALNREEQAGRTVDERSRAAIEVARRYASGLANPEELAAARDAARDAAWEAVWDAAWATAWDATWATAQDAARYAAWDTWDAKDAKDAKDEQRQKFNALIEPLFPEARS